MSSGDLFEHVPSNWTGTGSFCSAWLLASPSALGVETVDDCAKDLVGELDVLETLVCQVVAKGLDCILGLLS